MPTLITIAIRQILTQIRWRFRIAILAVPALVAVYLTFLDDAGLSSFEISLLDDMYLVVILPTVAIRAATATTVSDGAAGMLLFLKSHPISPWKLATSNLLAAGLVTTAFLLPSVLLMAVIATSGSMSVGLILGLTLGTITGCLLYGALMATAGLVFQHPSLVSLLYIVSVEHFFRGEFDLLRWVSVREYMMGWMIGFAQELGPNLHRPVLSTTSAVLGSFVFLAALISYSTGRLSVLEVTDAG